MADLTDKRKALPRRRIGVAQKRIAPQPHTVGCIDVRQLDRPSDHAHVS
ncbi:MAG: hypothetical protein ABF868_01105 [Sporolactobacillus sp.]